MNERGGVPALAVASAIRTLHTERDGLSRLAGALGGALAEPFAAAVALLGAAARDGGRVIVSGMGKSGHVARKAAATFSSTGTPAYFLHAAEASHGDLGIVQPHDVIVALSWSGETAELADLISYARRFRVGLVAVTANAESALGREADIVLELPKAEEACPNGLAPTTSTTMQMALGDALAVALLEARGFSATDFRVFHPGGKLGAKLTLVRDVMHTGAAVPTVSPEAGMGEAIIEMTARGFGAVGVRDAAGRLIGVVTDGDLRRHMGPDLTTRRVDAVMSRTPRTIAPDTLAAEALDVINSARVTALFVVDGAGALLGILHIHDLLRLGAA